MIEQNIDAIAKACNGTIISRGSKNTIDKISTDSRTIKSDSLFIPLIGENFDGHRFIKDAVRKGASSVLVQKDKMEYGAGLENVNVIGVDNTLDALAQISSYYRNLFDIPFIGITGSVGKTTTKDFVAGVLAAKYNVHKNIGNFNNEIGLPLTLFNLETEDKISVLEMGMSSYGEILNLVNIVRPNIAVITNIGLSHIEHFGSKENVMKAKMEVATNLKENHYLLLNGDDDHLKNVDTKDKNYNIIFYGLGDNNDFYARNIKDLGEKGCSFDLDIDGRLVQFKIKQPGLHNIYNALVAIWIGIKYNMTAEEIQAGLGSFELSQMRLEIINSGNIKIINDAYNASPDSMKAALDVLENIEASRKIAVLGNMFEMGSFAEEGHRDVGRHLANKQIDLLVTVGEMAKWIGLEAKARGFKEDNIFIVDNNKEANEVLKGCTENKDAILVKGSRGMNMEQIVRFLQERSQLNDIGK